MHIGFISTRLNGTDGVSLEVAKWSHILQKQGHEIFYCAGELGGYANNGTLIPKLHFGHQSIRALSKRAFGEEAETSENIRDEIYNTADELARTATTLHPFEQIGLHRRSKRPHHTDEFTPGCMPHRVDC